MNLLNGWPAVSGGSEGAQSGVLCGEKTLEYVPRIAKTKVLFFENASDIVGLRFEPIFAAAFDRAVRTAR